MATGTRKKEGDVFVALHSFPALNGLAASSDDGHWEDWPIVYTNRIYSL